MSSNIYDEIILKQYERGYRTLSVLTGYASSAFVHHIVHEMEELKLNLIIGMAKYDPITIWDHNEYLRITDATSRLKASYFIGTPPIHSKAVIWEAETGPSIAFAGSANFTWNGYRDFQEIMFQVEPELLKVKLPSSEDLIDCTDPLVFTHVKMSYQERPDRRDINTSAVGAIAYDKPSVNLKLYSEQLDEVPEKSGLNWGQRPGREQNQAYIFVPKQIHREMPGFFPNRGEQFTIITDDGESFVCVIAQDGNKAIETTMDNSIIGRYFRKRLGLSLGTLVKREHLQKYGREHITIYKLDDRTFFMDYQPEEE